MESAPQGHSRGAVTGAAYTLLFLLGVLEGVIGCFQYGGSIGVIPVAALILCLIIFGTCLLGGLGMGSAAGAFAPAAGWFAASFVLSLPTGGGSVIITNTAAGMWYLYGGAVAATAAVMLVFTLRQRLAAARR